MANSIDLAQTYLPLLDEVYKVSSRTAILDSTKVEIVNGNTVKVFKTSMDGLGDYNRANGFTHGDVTGTWETLTLGKDRGRSFVIDRMDNEESIGMAFGTLAGEFIRTRVAPEIDAYTFAKMAGAAGIDMGTADAASRIMEIMQDKGVGYLAVSLGYFKTLFSNSGKSTSSEVPDDLQKEMGMSEGLIRFSVGLDNDIERTFQLIAEAVEESKK